MQRAQLIRKLVLDSHYVIDEHLVARAILARATVRGLLGEAGFRNDERPTAQVRSFRPSRQARSFRPCTLGVSMGRRGGILHLGLM